LDFVWRFSDSANTEIGQTVTHVFANSGTHTVSLTLGNRSGLTGFCAETVTAYRTEPPTALWKISSTAPEAENLWRVGEPIDFDASSSSAIAGRIVEYAWDWDSDGVFDEVVAYPIKQHIFSSAGSHTVTLRISDDRGGMDAMTETISIFSKEVATGIHDYCQALAFSPDGGMLATGGYIDKILIRSARTGTLIRTLTGHTSGGILSVSFSSKGSYLASGMADGTIRLWNAATGTLLHTITGHPNGAVNSLSFSPDGALLASGSSDDTIKLWNVSSGQMLRTLSGHTDRVMSVAFSPDGKTLASGSNDKTIKLWDVSSGEVLRTLSAYGVWSVAFSPDGETLASGSHDKTIKLWDAFSGTLIRTLTGHTGYVHSVAFSPDGEALASGSGDGTIRLWDASSGTLIHTLIGRTDDVHTVAVSPDGEMLASGTFGDTIFLWEVAAILHPNDVPVASFAWHALSSNGARLAVEPRKGGRIVFDASASSDADGEIVEYAWDWGSDGSYEFATSDPVAEYSFASAGSHRVTLRVTDDVGAMDTVSRTITIQEDQPPSAAFGFTPLSPSIMDTAQFTDSSTDEDGQITTWHWDFGDGSTSTERHPVHQYATKGTFAVSLTVTDDDGLTAYVDRDLEIVNLPPEGTYAWGVVEEEGMRLMVEPRVGKPLRFDASTSADSDGEIVEYAWDWDGDGSYDETTTEPVTDHWFDDEGVHDITLRVTDDDGGAGTYAEAVTILAAQQIVEPDGVWALVVGVSDYTDVNDLTYARSDAEAFARWLIDAGVSVDSITLLLDEAGELEDLGLQYDTATLSRFRAGLGWLRKQAKPDDLVFVYFAGHGYQGEDDDGDEADGVDEFLVLHDTMRSAVEETALRDDEFGAFLDRVGSDHVMVVFDSCHSGGQSRSLSSGSRPLGDTFDLFNDFSLEGKLILAAAREDQEALEHEGLGHGLFTHFLLQGLKGDADLDSDYRITAEELHAYVSTEVERYAWEVRGREQTPEMTGRGEVGIVVSRTNRPPEASFNVQPEIPYAHGKTCFEDASIDDTEIVSWQWAFGDGATSTDRQPTHTYDETGSYTITLTVTDDEGETSTSEQEIVIAPPGEVTTVAGDTIIISLGTANGVEVGDRFEVVRVLLLSSGQTIEEHKATIAVIEILDADRSACRVINPKQPIQAGDMIHLVTHENDVGS